MSTKPMDTTADAWIAQRRVLSRMGPADRVQIALELSESVREIQVAGLLARNSDWDKADAIRHLVAMNLGVDLPRPS